MSGPKKTTNLRGNNKITRRDSPRGRYQGSKANAFNKLAEILNPEFIQTYKHTHANNSHLETKGSKKLHNYLVYSVKIGNSCKAVPCFYPGGAGFLFGPYSSDDGPNSLHHSVCRDGALGCRELFKNIDWWAHMSLKRTVCCSRENTDWNLFGVVSSRPGSEPKMLGVNHLVFLFQMQNGRETVNDLPAWSILLLTLQKKSLPTPSFCSSLWYLTCLVSQFQQNLNTDHWSLIPLIILFPKGKILFSLYFPYKNSLHHVNTYPYFLKLKDVKLSNTFYRIYFLVSLSSNFVHFLN